MFVCVRACVCVWEDACVFVNVRMLAWGACVCVLVCANMIVCACACTNACV